jgi:hypothetical protein
MVQLVDRAKMTVATAPGAGVVALGAAVAGYQSFAAAGVANGAAISYVIEDGANWEYGHGTYSSTGPTLTRTTILGSSNGGAAIAASAAALVFASVLAEDLQPFAGDSGSGGVAGMVPEPPAGAAASNLVLGAGSTPWVGRMAGFRNRLINGAFDVWQRGTTFTPLGASPYTADRWVCVRYADVGNFVLSKATGILQNGVNRSALHVQRTPGDTITANPIWLSQSVESLNCHDLAGQSVILSLYVRVGANFSSSNLTVAIRSGTGTDERAGAYTGDALVASLNVPPSQTTYARFSCTGTLAANANELGVFITYSPTGTAGANDWFEILDVQLEPGQVATPFERRPIGVELALCQRYFQTAVYNLSYYCGQASFGFYQILTLPVTMRASPTTGLNNTLNYGASTTVTLSADDPSHLHFTITDSAVGSVGINGAYTASADL